MYCYRRYGHNEADEPRFTQPLMYAAVDKKPSVREIYVRRLLELGNVSERTGRGDRTRAPASPRRGARSHARPAFRAAELLDARSLGGVRRRRRRRVPRRRDRGAGRAARACSSSRPRACRPTFTCTPSSSACSRCAASMGRGQASARLGHRRARRIRIAGQRGLLGAPERPGRAARHLQPSPRRAARQRHSGALYTPLVKLAHNQARFEVWDSPLSEAGRARVRVRLQPGLARRARAVGGAVRRLRERRAGHHRPVHLVRPKTSGTASAASSACCHTASKARARSTPARASSAC